MPDRLLETKLSVPVPRRTVVQRPRLDERLRRGLEGRLTLISAPPGFGKTTVLTSWIAGTPDRPAKVGWVALDEGDNDPTTFWRYVVAALERAASGVGHSMPLSDPNAGFAVGPLVNALARLAADVVLVLDDLHVVETAQIHDDLTALLERLPPQVHLVIATRADPPLPLARLRAHGELVEIRASDLRFTPDEAAAYLNQTLRLGLTGEDVAALEARTEGWIAALQLAALSLEGRADASSFVERFAGDDRYVFDYLADEVLARQPETVRAFLTHTSILDRLTAPLCDALTGRTDGRAMLDLLDRANLFLVALDDRRRWYRYHHLFTDALRARLLDEEPGVVADLHGRASAWFEAHGEEGDEGEAIRHALAGGAVDRAADLIEVVARSFLQARQEMTLRRWLDALPDRVYDVRPVLADVHAGVLLASGEVQRVEARLDAAERWVDAATDDRARAAAEAAGMVVRRGRAFRHLPGAVALHRAGLDWVRGDADATIVHAERALMFAGEDEPLERGGASGMLGLAYWTRGDLDAAHAAWSEAVRNLERAGNHADVLGCSIAVADIRLAQGRPTDARQVYERGLRFGTEGRTTPLRGSADMHVGLAEVHREWNELATARHHLEASAELGEALALPQNAYRLRVAMAGIREAEGDLEAAVDLLDEAERRYAGDFFPPVRPIHAVRARIGIRQERLADARAWARERGLSPDDDLGYLREYEHLTLARLLVASTRLDTDRPAGVQALALLGRLRVAADTGGRGRSSVEARAVEALAHHALGDRERSIRALEGAVTLAEPEGYVRLFVDEGAPMAALLGDLAKVRPPTAYAGRLAAAFGARPAAVDVKQPLLEPLSERELEVLRLLTSDLDGPGIARELFVSVNTLRTHTKNIFAKLGVSSRRAAVRRASELGLLPPTVPR